MRGPIPGGPVGVASWPIRGPVRALPLALLLALVVAACGASRPALDPGATVVPPDRVMTPAPSAPVTPAPTALPDAAAAADAVLAYSKLVARASLSYRVAGTQTEFSAKGVDKVALTVDVAGPEYGGTATLGGKSVRFAYVDGAGWAKAKNGRWASFPVGATVVADIVHPWGYVCWLNDLAYTGHPAKQPDAFGYACKPGYTYQTPRMRGLGETALVSTLALVLAADGTPISMRIAGEYPGTSASVSSFTSDLRFSGVGKPVTIKGPK